MRRCRLPYGRAQIGLDQNFHIIRPDLLENFSRLVRIQVIDKRGIERHDQSFARWDAGGFLDFLRAYGNLVVGLEWVDDVKAFG